MAFTQNFDFNQADYAGVGGGVCAVLSACWIREMRDHKGQGPAQRKLVLEQAIRRFAPRLQNVYSDKWSQLDSVKRKCAWVLRLAGDSQIVGEPHYNLNGVALTNYVKDLRRTGFHYNFGGAGGGGWGHAVGIWRSGHAGILPSGHVYVFDPNQGEFIGNKSDLARFIDNRILNSFDPLACSWTYCLRTDKPTQGDTGSQFQGRRAKVM
ncbi:MAG: hypothetical protein JSW66_03545 [Phycisphaerales bacterium]|nr:MAG: hypothetical protein JSW66_03545 [Phycisphaerales bacterium]